MYIVLFVYDLGRINLIYLNFLFDKNVCLMFKVLQHLSGSFKVTTRLKGIYKPLNYHISITVLLRCPPNSQGVLLKMTVDFWEAAFRCSLTFDMICGIHNHEIYPFLNCIYVVLLSCASKINLLYIKNSPIF